MAFPVINQAVAKVVMEVKLRVIDDLIAYIETKIEADEDLRKIFNEFKDVMRQNDEKAIKIAGKKSKKSADNNVEKKKRQPSVFNLYVKDIMPSIRSNNPDVKDGKQLISFAAQAWKNDIKVPFIKSKVLELKKDDATSSIIELYTIASNLWKANNTESIIDTSIIEKEKEIDIISTDENIIDTPIIETKIKSTKAKKK